LPRAWAGPSGEDRALALQLFDEGRGLLAAGSVDDACRKLEESNRLDPLPGTLLNVAVCHERQGRAASAVAELREARAFAERDGRADRVALADQHLKVLEPKVSTLVIVVPPETELADLAITRDGSLVGRAAWSTPIPVDPGAHVIAASASNRTPRSVTVVVGRDGDVQTVTLSPLDALPAQPLMPEPAPERRGLSARRAAAVVCAGLGLASVAVGAYFGGRAIAKHDDPASVCTLRPCTVAQQINADAATSADVSTVTIAAGLAVVALAAFLWLGDSGGTSSHARVVVSPAVTPNGGGLHVAARF
jgi:hypothetical protein